MINANVQTKKLISSVFFGSLIKFFTPYKVSFIVGSSMTFFSLSNCIVPLVGVAAGLPGAIALFLLNSVLRLCIHPSFSLKLCALYVPGFVASCAWIERGAFFVRCIIPLFCMGLFILHPVGAKAWLYTLYWLIPVGIYLIDGSHIFLRALTSTLVAHAVGSILWLYADPMTSATWLSLIPVVAVERLLFASGMTIAYMVISYCYHAAVNKVQTVTAFGQSYKLLP